uniref:PQQ-binding-like beta-propeller repeat protein n=1 Tax=Aristophania vespae TaxID=2697033 RepID=UPI00191C6EEB|nr:PQQ-binding-like beta-propeller repeat protein [Aristophania vespae]
MPPSARLFTRLNLFLTWVLAAVLGLTGLYFLIGGGWLLSLGGSSYFILESIILFLSSAYLIKRSDKAFWLFLFFYVTSVIWAIWDAGFDFWPLISRLMMPSVLLLVFFIVLPYLRQARGKKEARKLSWAGAWLTALGLLVTVWGMFVPHPPVAGPLTGFPLSQAKDGQGDWSSYGRDEGGSRYVPFSEINLKNVSKLHKAWVFRTGDIAISPDGNGAEDQQTPLQIGDKIFLCTPHNNVIAVDVDTGKSIWKAAINSKSKIWQRCRGLAYYDVATAPKESGNTDGTSLSSAPKSDVQPSQTQCQRRLFVNTTDARLIALDADNGSLCEDFGDKGTVDLLQGLGAAPDPQYQVTSPPIAAGKTVVVGGRVADNVSTDMPGGVIRGYDVMTGKLAWAFDARNPDPNHKLAPGETYRRSSANSWAPMSYDSSMNVVFIPMGSSSVDLWGVPRTAEDHKYATSILALDANTGKERWVYQTVHNDLWDFDIPMQPSLIDVPTAEGKKAAVVFGTKAGQIFVLDRHTGKPLTDVKELPVPSADIPGEQYSKTQPFSVGMPQIGAGPLTESDMWGLHLLISWPVAFPLNQCAIQGYLPLQEQIRH